MLCRRGTQLLERKAQSGGESVNCRGIPQCGSHRMGHRTLKGGGSRPRLCTAAWNKSLQARAYVPVPTSLRTASRFCITHEPAVERDSAGAGNRQPEKQSEVFELVKAHERDEGI